MDLPWGDEKTVQFITNVGLVTSDGPHGQNIMACEWTHHVSYSPGMIAICVGPDRSTVSNIRKSKKFGVSLASAHQNIASSVAGGYSGAEYNKIEALKELGFKFYTGKNGIQMIEGASLNAECNLVKEVILGDHIMFVGEVTAAKTSGKESLAYHRGKYWVLNTPVEKPSEKDREKIKKTVEKHKKK